LSDQALDGSFDDDPMGVALQLMKARILEMVGEVERSVSD
jgi:hypothetical protein